MLKEQFLGRNPSHFNVNPVVKAYLVSEVFFWSAWNFITPLFAVFVTTEVAGGNVQIAASCISALLISRVIFELLSGKILLRASDRRKLYVTVWGLLFISASYIGFLFFQGIWSVFILYCCVGAGVGIAAPAKSSLFSLHLDKDKAATEWSLVDAACAICMAATAALGGFIATVYGFNYLFLMAAMVNIISVIPYLILAPNFKNEAK